MSLEKAAQHLRQWNREGDILQFQLSTATVAEAAAALNVAPGRIAKSISVQDGDGAMLVVAAGDVKLDNRKFKDRFGQKPRMLSADEAVTLTGHAVGGVCPFGLPAGVPVYLDASLRRFDTVFPACGSSNSAIELALDALEQCASNFSGWVDVCKQPQTEQGV